MKTERSQILRERSSSVDVVGIKNERLRPRPKVFRETTLRRVRRRDGNKRTTSQIPRKRSSSVDVVGIRDERLKPKSKVFRGDTLRRVRHRDRKRETKSQTPQERSSSVDVVGIRDERLKPKSQRLHKTLRRGRRRKRKWQSWNKNRYTSSCQNREFYAIICKERV